MTFEQLVAQYGLLTVAIVYVTYQIINSTTRRSVADTKQDEVVTGFAVDFNAERKELQNELKELRDKQAREEGRREQLESSWATERKESREREREMDNKMRSLEQKLGELSEARQKDQSRITELETEQERYQREITDRDKTISLLEAQKRELEAQLQREVNRAASLSQLVERLQASDVPDVPGKADDTYIPEETNPTKQEEQPNEPQNPT